ncbi:MAG: branched-chain-amino-acid transaminase [Gaiellales bacterium]
MVAYVDGEWMDSADARISVFDHGLLYGDGVFEGIRFYGHEPFLLDAHLCRLAASARAICLEIGVAQADLAGLTREAVARSGMADGYIRLIVTRGPGALGVSPHTCSAPTVILMVAPLALYSAEAYANGIVLVTSSMRRSASDALPAQAKTLNYLTSVLASIEARRQGADEAILLNDEGIVAECTADNLFVVSGGRVFTPTTAQGALSGITRGLVGELLGELGICCEKQAVTLFDVWTADELFLTGTGAEVVAVRLVDGRPLPSSRPVTDAVAAAFRAYIEAGPARWAGQARSTLAI